MDGEQGSATGYRDNAGPCGERASGVAFSGEGTITSGAWEASGCPGASV